MQKLEKISFPTSCVSFSLPQKFNFTPNFILQKFGFHLLNFFLSVYTYVFNRLKVRFTFTELYFKSINGNSGGEKEKRGWEEKSSKLEA
jgi:hypothetical protein